MNMLRMTIAHLLTATQTPVRCATLLCGTLLALQCDGLFGPIGPEGRAAHADEMYHSAKAEDEPAETGDDPATTKDAAEFAAIVGQLDSPKFDARNKATDAILARGKSAIPFLVAALSTHSRETQFRAAELLRKCYSFEDVAPPLIADLKHRNDALTRSVLLERAARQVNATTGLASADKLFEFWGTSLNAYRREVLNQLAEAKTGQDVAKVVTPLVDLNTTAARFEKATQQMSSLGLSYKSQYSATYVVARTLARGLLERDPAAVNFAEAYVRAISSLARSLQDNGVRNSAMRKELDDRAVYSQGAAAFLVKTLDSKSPTATLLAEQLSIDLEQLRREFLAGLADPDAKECYRRIGKTHIADMLSEAIHGQADMLDQPSLAQLVTETWKTVQSGDKPKALALLDALDACRDLPEHGLAMSEGFGKQLAERLAKDALQAPDNRAYHPTRAFHNRIVAMCDAGVTSGHSAFPSKLITAYLGGVKQTLTDNQRQAFERYVRILTLLSAANVPLDAPPVERFVVTMRDDLMTDHAAVGTGLIEVMRLTSKDPQQRAAPDTKSIIQGLSDWSAKRRQR